MFPRNFKPSERGSILIFTVLIMGSMLAITLALAAIYNTKVRSTREAGPQSVTAIYAADSALEWCLYNARGNSPTLSQPTIGISGATYTISGSCNGVTGMNVQVVGSYNGVSRSLQVTTP